MRHNASQGLLYLWNSLSTAWTRMMGGAGWQDDKNAYGIEGYLRLVEVTVGENGWHVHVHTLLFVMPTLWYGPMGAPESDALGRSMFARWSRSLKSNGLDAPTYRHGVDMRRVVGDDVDALGDYFTKNTYAAKDHKSESAAAFEVTGSHAKKGRSGNRTPFELLEDIVSAAGDVDRDIALWHEWEKQSKGRRQLTWSRGLRDRLLSGVEDLDDQAVAEADDLHGEAVVLLTGKSWRKVTRMRLEPTLLDAVEVSTAALIDVLRWANIAYRLP
jgi:hypothetical protein